MTNTDSPLEEILISVYLEGVVDNEMQPIISEAKQAIELYCHKQVIEELESVFSDIDGELWYAHPSMAKGNIANEITLKDRIEELRKTL